MTHPTQLPETLATGTLPWSERLALDHPVMDATHREFTELMGEVERAADADLLAAWNRMVAHTVAHFGAEDRWMLDTGFASGNCHTTQHMTVLRVLVEAATQARGGDLRLLRDLIPELATWFAQHVQSLDAALALHLRSAGYDPVLRTLAHPDALPAQAIAGCGSAACGDVAVATETQAVPG